MTGWSATTGSVLVHALHHGVVAAGLLGVLALLAPALVHRASGSTTRSPDVHQRRVADLRAALAAGRAGSPDVGAVPAPSAARGRTPAPLAAGDRPLLLPVAVVASALAAGVHAAVGPAHLREGLLIGSFFVGSAAAQLAWAALVLRRPGVPLLVAGAVGNLGALGLWAWTRTVGLPAGLAPGPEAVGPWDVTAAVAETAVVVLCVGALVPTRAGALPRAVGTADRPWPAWHPAATAVVGVSAVVLVTLTLSGARA